MRSPPAPPPLGNFQTCLATHLPCLSLFIPKIMSYNISFRAIDRYKIAVAIPLLDSLIIQMQDGFLTKIATPAICFV